MDEGWRMNKGGRRRYIEREREKERERESEKAAERTWWTGKAAGSPR